jgi:predicted metal-dependent hydrolase
MLQLDLNFLSRTFSRIRNPSPVSSRINRQIEWKHGIRVDVTFRPRARRYLLALQANGIARLVIPRRGTEAEGLRFLDRSEEWLLKRVAQWHSRSPARLPWTEGTRFLFRGEEAILRVEESTAGVKLAFADQVVRLKRALPDYRATIHAHLRRMAEKELSVRTRELAQAHGIAVKRVSIRAQKTRWGSCSARGTISLNWRLIQAPPFVVDYLIIHELMHRREMNHSKRYWKLVAEAFPDYRHAEKWLKSGGVELRA